MDWRDKPCFTIPEDAKLTDLSLAWQGRERARVPGRLNYFLREYQRDGVRFLWDRYCRDGGAILADDMGLGKTVQIIALLSALYHKTGLQADNEENRLVSTGKKPCSPTLIICPGSVLSNWEEEIKTWGNFVSKKFYKTDRDTTLTLSKEGRCELVLTTFETGREHISVLNLVDWRLVIVDECHRIKEPTSGVTRALKSLECKRRIGLTGTALQNKYEELWCLLDWANPGCLGSCKHFQGEFSVPMTRGSRFDATKQDLAIAREKQNQLNQMKRTWMIRRTKSKTISDQLPRKNDQVVFCSLSPFQVSMLQCLVSHPDTQLVLKAWSRCSCGGKRPTILCCQKQLSNKDGVSPRILLLQLMHIFIKAANHAALLLPGRSAAKSQERISSDVCNQMFQDKPKLLEGWRDGKFLEMADTTLSGKMAVLSGLLHVIESQRGKVLLFSYSTRVLDILSMFLRSKGYTYTRLDGNTKMEQRQRLVNEFNTDPGIFVFLVSTKAGGVGLNITGANNVIVFDPNWNPSHDLQAQDRAYRIGQTRDVNVYRLISVGCIEEIIYLRQVYKQQLAASSVDGETARRYFLAVQGDPTRKGELFGIRNLFRVNPVGQCLTLDIEERNREMEERVKGLCRSKVQIQPNLLPENLEETTSDPFNIGLEVELEGAGLEDIESVLAKSGVIYSHMNQGVVGSSRAEQHISECAVKDLESGSVPGYLPAEQCDILTPSQGLVCHEEPKLGYQPQSAGNRPKRTRDGEKTFIYGETPEDVKMQIFLRIANQEKLNPTEFAEKIGNLDFLERMKIIERFHQNQNTPASVFNLLKTAKEEYTQELKNTTLRRISYQPSINYIDQHKKGKDGDSKIPRGDAFQGRQKETKVLKSNEKDFNLLQKTLTDTQDEESFSDDEDILTKVLDRDEFSEDDDIVRVLDPMPEPTLIYPKHGAASSMKTTTSLTPKFKNKEEEEEDDMKPIFRIKPAPPPGIVYKRIRLDSVTPEPKDPIDEIFDDDDDDLNEIFKKELKPGSSTSLSSSSTLSKPSLKPRLERKPSSEDPCYDMIFN